MIAFEEGIAAYRQQVRDDIALHGFGNFYFSDHYRSGRVSPMPSPPAEPHDTPDTSRAPTPVLPIAGFPDARPTPYPIQCTEPVAVPPTSPFLTAISRALDRDDKDFQLQADDFSPRARRFLELPADQRSHRTSSPSTDSETSSGRGGDDRAAGSASPIRNESDPEDDPDEEPLTIGASAVLPPASTATGPVEVEASFPHAFLTPEDGPYIVQVDLPRDYVDAGVAVRTRVRVNVSFYFVWT